MGGRPPVTDDGVGCRNMTFRLSFTMWWAVKRIAKDRGTTQGSVIRDALTELIEKDRRAEA